MTGHTRFALPFACAVLLLASGCEKSAEEPEASAAPSFEAEPEVSAAPTPAPTSESASPPDSFTAVGTEPFWSARIRGSSLTYMTPEFPEGSVVPVERTVVDGATVYSGDVDGKPLELRIVAGACSDGMSDTAYKWAVTRTIGPDEQKGCAKVP